jgi:menaquinone-dependent protoporphyrinogen oxidase
MNVLITYSSGFGSTREVAEKIAGTFKERGGLDVTVLSIDNVQGIDAFDVVVVGSSVRADRPLANVRDFFARYNEKLIGKQLAIFAVCLAANCSEGRDRVKHQYIAQIIDKYPELKPISTGAFGGKLDFDRLNPVMRTLAERVLEKTGVPTKGSVDTRDWNIIETWAINLRNQLLQAA